MHKLGRFDIVGEIGRGGCGVVYRATDPKIGRQVAIKTILPDGGAPPIRAIGPHTPLTPDDPTSTMHAEGSLLYQRLLVEAQSAGRLSHPNIVTIHELDEYEGTTFIVMELVEGRTLAARMQEGSMGSATAVDLLRQIASALDHAHGHGVVHRDIKPANILMTANSVVKVTDFGIAKVLQSELHLTRTGTSMGSAFYMAPEQIEARPVSPQTDQFALGVIAYELLTGSRPFRGDSWASVLHQILNVDPPAASTLREGLSDHVTNVLRRALSKQPINRYANCGDFVNDLDHAVLGRTDIEATLPFPKVAAAPARKRVWWIPALVGAGVAVAAGSFIAVRVLRQPAPSTVERPPVLMAGGRSPESQQPKTETAPKQLASPVSTPPASSPQTGGAAAAGNSRPVVAATRAANAPPVQPETLPTPTPIVPSAPAVQPTPPVAEPPPVVAATKPAPTPIVEPASAKPAPAPPPVIAPDEKAWADLAGSRNVAALEQFRREHPNSPHAREAADRIAQLEWERVRGSGDAKALNDYVARFPTSTSADEARGQIRTLEAAARTRQTRQMVDATLERFRTAVEHRSMVELRRVWPDLPGRDQTAFQNFFANAREISMSLRLRGEPEILGDVATVHATRSMQMTGPQGREKPQENAVVIRLKRTGPDMVIESVTLGQ